MNSKLDQKMFCLARIEFIVKHKPEIKLNKNHSCLPG